MNKAQLIGHLTHDLEIRQTNGGQSCVSFTIATNRMYLKGTEQVRETEFHSCVVFGKTADFMNNYVKKGDKLFVEGRLQTRTWEDTMGTKRNKTEIIVSMVEAMTKRDTSTTPDMMASVTEITKPKETTLSPDQAKALFADELSLEDIPF